jgi:hypothetical protein
VREEDEVQYHWREAEPIRTVAFLLNDTVVVRDDEGRTTTGAAVALRTLLPVPEYEVRLADGRTVVRKQSELGSTVPGSTAENLAWIQKWYASQCDDEWEHEFGLKINTLDNPGWFVEIDLSGTDLEGRPFESVNEIEPERAWISCKIVKNGFQGAGGPHMLAQILDTFVRWAREGSPASTQS